MSSTFIFVVNDVTPCAASLKHSFEFGPLSIRSPIKIQIVLSGFRVSISPAIDLYINSRCFEQPCTSPIAITMVPSSMGRGLSCHVVRTTSIDKFSIQQRLSTIILSIPLGAIHHGVDFRRLNILLLFLNRSDGSGDSYETNSRAI